MGEYKKAIEDCDAAIELSPNLARAYVNRGRALRHLGQYEKALVDLNKAISLDDSLGSAYFNRAEAYQKLAETDLKDAKKLGYTAATEGTVKSTH